MFHVTRKLRLAIENIDSFSQLIHDNTEIQIIADLSKNCSAEFGVHLINLLNPPII